MWTSLDFILLVSLTSKDSSVRIKLIYVMETKWENFHLIHELQIPFFQLLMFSLIQSINAVQFVPKKCSKSTTCSLSFISDVGDSISKAKSFQFSGVNCNWKMSIHFLAIDRPHNSCLFPLRIQLNLKSIVQWNNHSIPQMQLIKSNHLNWSVTTQPNQFCCQFSKKFVHLKIFPHRYRCFVIYHIPF